MVYRVYVEKRSELALEAASLANDLKTLLQIEGITSLRLFNRYDVEGISAALFTESVKTILSEPQLDVVTETLSVPEGATVFAVEYLPGQFDQRADSGAQGIQLASQGERPWGRSARGDVLGGTQCQEEMGRATRRERGS